MPFKVHTHRYAVNLCIFFLALIFIASSPILAQGEKKDEFSKLEEHLFQAFKDKEYEKALKIAERMHAVNPRDADTLYNMAALHALLGNEKEAQEWLLRAIEEGGLRSFRRSYCDKYIAVLEHKDRAAFQKPERVMEVLAFKPDERVADIGAGSGYFTIRIAKAVGPKGQVWAVDIEQAMLDYIEEKCSQENLCNVKLQLVQEDNPQLPDHDVDTILLVHTYAHLPDRVQYMIRLKDALVPGGRIVIIEYNPASWEQRPWGPLPHQQVARKTVDSEMAQAGFTPVKVYDFLPGQYFIEYQIKK